MSGERNAGRMLLRLPVGTYAERLGDGVHARHRWVARVWEIGVGKDGFAQANPRRLHARCVRAPIKGAGGCDLFAGVTPQQT